MTDSEDELESWQNQLYEHHEHRSGQTTKSLKWLTSQPTTIPVFDGSTDPEPFIVQFSAQIPEPQKMEALESTFRATAVRWWKGHKKKIPSWEVCQKLLRLRFTNQPQEVRGRFDGMSSSQDHLAQWYEACTSGGMGT